MNHSMSRKRKHVLAAAVASAGLASVLATPAHALLITFSEEVDGELINAQVAGDNSGLTSALIDASNKMPFGSGFFVETFDRATASALPAVSIPDNEGFFDDELGAPSAGTMEPSLLGGLGIIEGVTESGEPSGCSINAWGGPAISAGGGGFGVRKGGVSYAATPADNDTCFAYGPQQGGTTPATVKIDYAPILQQGDSINYLGLYYGSVDDYNEIIFYSGNENEKLMVPGTLLDDGTLSGQEILDAREGQSGDRVDPRSNVYANFFFEPGETFTAFEFKTTGVAFEFDNVVVGLASRDVPAPAPLALLGLGLAGLVFARRGRGRR
ncbi:MAG: Npun_F0296 family exosortase-dependent surface protein [Pseudohaliea sp.]